MKRKWPIAGAISVAALAAALIVWRGHGATPEHGHGPAASGPRLHGAAGGTRVPAWLAQPGVGDRRISGRVIGGPATIELRSRIGPMATLEGESFDFGPWPAAEYALVARAPGKTAARLELDARNPSVKTEGLELVLGTCLASLRGTVRDASGGVVAGAQILADRAGAAVTGANGEYELCVRPGRPFIEVSADGYGAVARELEVYGQVKRDFDLVPEAVIVGRAVHEDGSPAAEALIEASSAEMGSESAPREALADEDGRFRLSGLGADRYAVRARDETSATSRVAEVAVAAGETSPDLTLVLSATSILRGHVVADGKPVAGAEVATSGLSAVSQADGAFVLAGLPRHEVELTAHPYRVVAPETVDVKDPIEEVEIEVERQASIRGRVVADGKPVAGAAVWARAKRAGSHDESAVDGTFTLEGLPPGTYRVGAESKEAGAFARDTDIALEAGEDKTGVEIDMDLAGEISGVVVDQHGAAVPGVYVAFRLIGGNDFGEAVTGADGAFTARQLSGGGDYAVKVAASQRSPQMLLPAEGDAFPHVAVADGRSRVSGVRLAVHLDRLVIAGQVVNGKGEPVPDARVRARNAELGTFFGGWWDLPSSTTDGDGRFEIRDLLAGSYHVQARSSAGAETVAESIEAGRRDLVIRVDEPGGIDVKLVDFPAGAEVLATRGSRMGAPIRALPSGPVQRLRGLVAGTYLVVARAGAHAASGKVEVASGRVAEITLRNLGTVALTGHASEFPSGAPIAGMTCRVSPRVDDDFGRAPVALEIEARTDANGRFSLQVPAGEVVVMCQGTDAQWMTIPVTGQGHVEVHAVRFPRGPYEGLFGIFIDESGTINDVVPGSPADGAGVRAGDVIADVDGAAASGLGMLVNLYLHSRPVGTTVRFGLLRGGSRIEISVTSIHRVSD